MKSKTMVSATSGRNVGTGNYEEGQRY